MDGITQVRRTPLRDRTAPRERELASMTDDEVMGCLRDGQDVFGELFRRHRLAAWRYARRLLDRPGVGDVADDVVSDGFRRVLLAVHNGNGPTDGFLPYLFSAVRASAIEHVNARRHERDATVRLAGRARAEHVDDPITTENGTGALTALKTLPPRWREVLWATTVLSMTPAEVGRIIDMPPNAVAALAFRARRGLRSAFAHANLPTGHTRACREALARVARGVGELAPASPDAHLHHCTSCRTAARELADVVPARGLRAKPIESQCA